MKLRGFTSASESIDVAFKYMFNELKQDEVPILYQITGLS